MQLSVGRDADVFGLLTVLPPITGVGGEPHLDNGMLAEAGCPFSSVGALRKKSFASVAALNSTFVSNGKTNVKRNSHFAHVCFSTYPTASHLPQSVLRHFDVNLQQFLSFRLT